MWLCFDTGNVGVRDDNTAKNQGEKAARICHRHWQAVGRELARHLITTCTAEGDLIVEAYTSSEATLVAAAELGRWAVACKHLGFRQTSLHQRAWKQFHENVPTFT